ncbi:MAG: polyribonucleotide nucleotidyltransferase [Gammaproteobacteria bacterium]|nr:MAG: polyribonucleotide nucleotidyltransferase [Gammaproteobacteria bacterium]
MFNSVKKEFQYGNQKVVIETGKVARQATSAVLLSMDDTTVLVSVVARKEAEAGRDFFPLTVNYQEKTYAAGRIPGGFLKREGRPSEKETLTCRLIDRPIRPLFAKGYRNEVQIVISVISANKETDPDIVALLGTSAALAIAGLPFTGPIGAARVGYVDGMYVLNPSYTQLKDSELDLVVAGTTDAVLMVESEAQELTEDQMLGGVLYGHQEMQVAITAIKEFAAEVGVKASDWTAPEENVALKASISEKYQGSIADAYRVTDKMERYNALGSLRSEAQEALAVEGGPSSDEIKEAFGSVEKSTVRESILSGEARIDGRDHKTVRAIDVEVGFLANTHGSALFTRGETQAIVVATLGSNRDAQMIDALEGTRNDPFMLHYNFPPFCVGETGFSGGPKRREIGHGRLARRGMEAVLPNNEDFPYTIRVVSEITESNGSSSMASVCGTSLSLMDAGVPLKAPVAGIAMGLVKESERFTILSDILGDEDHLGDMDFKVAGTEAGITALQMDIKIQGITEEIMEIALNQARDGRLHILGEMNKVITQSRTDVSSNAPSYATIQVKTDKIRDIIGKGGATIRGISEQTSATVDIDDSGLVKIYGQDKDSCQAALKMIEEITAEAEIGKIYEGTIARIVDFGAFVTFLPGVDGLVHISQISDERVEKVTDYLSEGQKIQVVVLDVDQRGRVKLSIKEVKNAQQPA